ncbi:hypothetical protein, partial [Rhizobium leguminosarum]|uniref:hypothetical protein n=1 Tax=Rhizobium leguminosarum TaxID=384 RepID=UPI001A8DC811
AAVDMTSAIAVPRINFFILLPPQSGARLHPPHAGAPGICSEAAIPRATSPAALHKNGTNKPSNPLCGIFIPFSGGDVKYL